MPHALHFLVLALAGWVTRHQEDRIDYLREENRVLREHLGPRPLRLTDGQRRRLAVRGQTLGRRILSQVAGIVTPDSILRWYRRLIAQKYDGSTRRDRSGVIVARALTEASVDDATTGITLIEATDGALGRVTAEAASETIGFYEAAGARGATVVVPPTRTANVSRYGPRSSARDRTILAVKERGRRRWKQTSGSHGQARVENAFFRYKSIIGDSLRACSPAGRGTELVLACNILNQMTGLGRPMSYRIGR